MRVSTKIPVLQRGTDLSIETFGNRPVAIWQRASLLGLIAAFLVMGILRLNDCDLFNPDSPRYVIYSQSIVDLGEYRATDLPGAPLYSWRPPGLSLLLAPMLALRPYDVVAAKVVVLLTGTLLLWIVFQLTALNSGFWPALIMTGVVASGPSFFVLSTEVLTEIPYTLGVLLVLLLLSRSTIPNVGEVRNQHWWSRYTTLGIAIAALSFTPWLRTAGVALVAAVGIWSVMCRARHQWLSGVAMAVVGVGLLAWRNKQAAGENYVGSLLSRYRDQGFGTMFVSGMDTVWHYIVTLPGLLLPGLTTDRAWYSPLTVGSSPTMALPYIIAACMAATLVSLAMLGMCNRRAQGGSLAILYVGIYCACLVVWPWRHERFLWPLIPVILTYVPMGLGVIASSLPALQSGMTVCGAVSMLALCGWQTVGCLQIVGVNQEFVKTPEAFYAQQVPGFYFSNWRRAGSWLNAHTSPSTRILTWHAAVAGTSHRFQKRVQFETVSPEKLRQQIAGFSARYLVVPAGQYGDGFGWQQLSADPAVQLKTVYIEQDVAILEVLPNRTGEVAKDAYPDWVNKQVELAESARKQRPARIDLAIRYASLLREAGRDDEALVAFRDLYDHGVKTVRVCAELGWLLYDARSFAEAAKFLDMARILPNAESIASTLAEGAARAREQLNEQSDNIEQPPIERRLNRVKSLMSVLKYAAAERELDRLIKDAPNHPEVLFVRGKLHHRLGELSQADVCYEHALKLGYTAAQAWLMVIRFSHAMAGGSAVTVSAGGQLETVDPSNPADHVRLAQLLQDHGWPGRALATLEEADARFPHLPSIQRPLGDLYRSFARPELAVPLYEGVLAINPGDESARQGLDAAQAALFEPAMFPLASRGNDDSSIDREGMNVSHR